jgi:hypothetical protein
MKSIRSIMENTFYYNIQHRIELDIERFISSPIKINVSINLRSEMESKIDIDSSWGLLSDQLYQRAKYKI